MSTVKKFIFIFSISLIVNLLLINFHSNWAANGSPPSFLVPSLELSLTISNPSYIASATDNSIWVADPTKRTLQHISDQGVSLSTFNDISSSNGFALAPDGSLWLSESTEASNYTATDYTYTVTHLDKNGIFISKFNGNGKGFIIITVANDGSLWVSQEESGKIQHLNTDGSLIKEIRSFDEPFFKVAVAKDGSFWATDFFKNSILHFTSNGEIISEIKAHESLPLFGPTAITSAPDGSVWVIAFDSPAILDFNSTSIDAAITPSTFISHLSSDGILLNKFQSPNAWSINISNDNKIWVAENDKLTKFSPLLFNQDTPAFYDDQTGKLFLFDVTVGDEHYQAILQQKNWIFSLSSYGVNPFYLSNSPNFDPQNNVLTLPLVQAFGQSYQAILHHQGNFVFNLQSAIKK